MKIYKFIIFIIFIINAHAYLSDSLEITLDLNKTNPKAPQSIYEDYQDSTPESDQAFEALVILNNFLKQASKAGDYINEDGDFISYNLTTKLLKLKLLSANFDLSTYTDFDYEMTLDYKIDYELNYNYQNYEKMAKKLINELLALKHIKSKILTLSQKDFQAFLNGDKTMDVNIFKKSSKQIFVFLKNANNYDLYIFFIPRILIDEYNEINFNKIEDYSINKCQNPPKTLEEDNCFINLNSYVFTLSIHEDFEYDEFSDGTYDAYIPIDKDNSLNNFTILAGSFSNNFGNLIANIDFDKENNIVIFPYFLEKAKLKHSTNQISQDCKSIKGFLKENYMIGSLDNWGKLINFSKKGGAKVEFVLNLVPSSYI